MPPREQDTGEQRETGRVEAFSDGVFAIAITLLVLELKVPPLDQGASRRALAEALLRLWPSFAAFLTSFSAILIMWMNHHGVFRMVRRVNGPFLVANGFLLLTVTFVPFPTAVLAGHVLGPSSTMAAAFYCGTYILVSIGYNALWSTATRGRLLVPGVPRAHIRKIRRAYRTGFFVYVAATGLALWNAHAGLALSTALWLLWGVLEYSSDKTGQVPDASSGGS
ncbi:MAG TPA: TMEM175 family protein [Thermoanaerobaculaceae bacterium]|nr:TMEM175 family protein [Thermoanaerobaculaceae bacterium]HPS76933.1 TMEM175 family protein [Thermoanaerobaculaceae bacterium]